MIKKICHLSDIHIRKTPTRNAEYWEVFKELIDSLKQKKPDIIVIVGDLVHDYLDLQGEQLIMAHNLLNDLSKIAPVRIIRGNHDCRKKNLKRIDSVKAIVETLRNPEVIYYDNTGFYEDSNIIWAVWHHGESKNNPWKTKEGKKILNERPENKTYIDLFHDPINGSINASGFEFNSKVYYKLDYFKGNYSFFGDIHRMQYLNKEKTKAFAGALICQNFGEANYNFNGYLLWDIENNDVEEINIKNNYSFKNIQISPYIDFNDLDFEIENPTKYMKIRFIWHTLPELRNKESERKLVEYVKNKYENITTFHKNEFIENENIDIDESVNIKNINDKSVQDEIFSEFLKKIGCEEKVVDDVIKLDDEITKITDIDTNIGVEWDIIKFGGTNFMSYKQLDVDWRDMEGLFQITGKNANGKTTILKLISYILYNKAIETEHRVKFGDKRYVNNRNDANYCDAYLVLECNGEYYGIKRKTQLKINKDGNISDVTTNLSYFTLNSPDDEMNDENSLEKLDEDRKKITQKNIDNIIGSYENFKRIVITTSDNLNDILSNNLSDFIDSLLFDSGLDIFDKKLEVFKKYQKKINEKSRIFCNVENVNNENNQLNNEIVILKDEINSIEIKKIPELSKRIEKGNVYVEEIIKKLFKIDDELLNLDVNETNEDIIKHENEKNRLYERKKLLKENINKLLKTYDSKKLDSLLEKKEEHKITENEIKFNNKEIESKINQENHKIEIINGKIFKLKEEGTKTKNEISEIKKSKNCLMCGQIIEKKEHQEHIKKVLAEKMELIHEIVEGIEKREKEKEEPTNIISNLKNDIKNNEKKIDDLVVKTEEMLVEIGTLNNHKNDVEKRNNLETELNQIPQKIENEELKLSILKQKISNYENNLKQIEENERLNKKIIMGKDKIKGLNDELDELKEDVFTKKTDVSEKEQKLVSNNNLVAEFKEQEYQDKIFELYKKCIHRDGIPKQMLTNYIIPKINITLQNILSITPFKIWLDKDNLRPKLAYTDRPNAIIDCISASGKERTFSSIVLKFALNQVNIKSKPLFFMLDEVMGKLTDESIEEFIEILQMIKNNIKRLLIIEHNHEISPNWLINVIADDDGISSLEIQ